ncbi:MAG TPA: IS200/IS605 family transposase [Gemmatimonadales bacterium]|nr:IS200/IS605 family transposase [Gemmatimonadales bacterium]
MAFRLYYHLVWTTRDRAALIDAGVAGFLSNYLRAIAVREKAQILEIGIVATHVHVLLAARPTTVMPALIQALKGSSSHAARKAGVATTGVELRWASGYHLSTVGERQLAGVREYVRNQPHHHPEHAVQGWSGDLGSR